MPKITQIRNGSGVLKPVAVKCSGIVFGPSSSGRNSNSSNSINDNTAVALAKDHCESCTHMYPVTIVIN